MALPNPNLKSPGYFFSLLSQQPIHTGEKENENAAESGNTLAPLGSFQSLPAWNSESGINPCGLRPTASCATEEYEYEKKHQRHLNTQERNKAYGSTYEITSDLIPTIVDKLRSCPTDAASLRVFRQHTDMGLCWHDSFFMMFFENDVTKPLALQLVTDFLTILLEKGYPGLSYQTAKTTLIARTLREKYKSTLKLSIWEHVTLALQRYALLGFLFVKESPTATETITKSRLLNRRPSLNESSFDTIHDYLKLGTMSCWEGGASMMGIQKFMGDVGNFVEEQTKATVDLEGISLTELKPAETIGYYFTIQAEADTVREWNIVGSAHIMSLFLCNTTWFLYDNETGVLPLNATDSEQISEKGVLSMQIYRTASEFVYKLTLGDKSVLTAKMPHTTGFGNESESEYYALTLPNASFRLIIKSKASNASGAGKAGGRRRTYRSKRKNRTRKAH